VKTTEQIDDDFVPLPARGLREVDVGHELVLANPQSGHSHVLNQTAALVWRCFDGNASLDQVIADLGDATSMRREVVRDDVLNLTRELGGQGLLTGVAWWTSPADGPAPLGPVRLVVGGNVLPFTLLDLGGQPTTLNSLLDQNVLLVNWNPLSPSCLAIAERLAALEDPLYRVGIELVFVTSGGNHVNRSIFLAAGLTARAVFKEAEANPFRGLDAPAACLVDTDVRIAAPVAWGPEEVCLLATQLAEVDNAPTGHRRRGGICVYHSGDRHLTVGFDSDYTASLLNRLFPGANTHESDTADDFFVSLHPPRKRRGEDSLLARYGRPLVRSPSAGRVLRGLLSHLSESVAPRDPSLLRVNATVAVRDREALVLPPDAMGWAEPLQRTITRFGFRPADVTTAAIDPRSLELIIPEVSIPHNRGAVVELDPGPPTADGLASVEPGPYRLGTWVVCAPAEQAGVMTPARGVASTIPLLSADRDAPHTLSDLVVVASHVRLRGIAAVTRKELATALRSRV
jgi:hypothetical protein